MDNTSANLTAELVRITARTSAVIVSASLAARAAELAWPQRWFSRQGAGWKLLAALLVSHTIHFAVVAVLTIEMHGQNVANRGGWILTTVVGVLFYAATGGALVIRRAPPFAQAVPNLVGDAVLSSLVGLAFVAVYVDRIGRSPLFAVLAALVSGALLAFVAVIAVRIFQSVASSPVRDRSSP